jgi:hypothetical protein
MSIVNTLLAGRTKKVTISFPTVMAMWEFFEISEVKEFRLDSSKCAVTGRFHSGEIEKAQKEMNAVIDQTGNC